MSGVIIYRGESMIEPDTDIVAIAVYTRRNRKTGPVVQTYILHESIDPMEASRTGRDSAICGDCMHRGKRTSRTSGVAAERSCYVALHHGPLQVWKSYHRGVYRDGTDGRHGNIADGRMVRLGTYGDPAAVPCHVWESLLARADGHTGYTHNAHKLPASEQRRLRKLCMFSADSVESAKRAERSGWRTFTVVAEPAGEYKARVLCPASIEAGKRSTCAQCRLCSGSESAGRSVYIPVHGNGKNIS